MIHMTSRLFLKPQLNDFLHHTVVLLLLQTHSCGGQSQVTVSMVGDDIILPCHIEPAVDASDLTVEWARPDLDPRFVHLRRDSVELLPEKNPLYRGRTSLSINKLKCGDVSLKLSKVKLSDEGSYRCFIPTFGTQSVVELAVGSVSSPEIEISKVSSEVMLECKSKGWYPQPEVSWLDAEGKRLSAGPTETFRGPDGLYTVSRRVTVEKRHSNTFTCRVQQKTINQTRETHVHVPADLFMVQSSSSVRISICLAVCFMFIVACFVVLWKGRRNQIKTSKNRNELLVEKETHRLAENEKIKYLEKAKGNLDEELQKNERESEYVKEMITELMRQKENLKNQREKLISLLQEDKTQIKEIKKKLKKKGTKQQQKLEVTEQREKGHEELMKNTGTLLETTENLIIKMTGKKVELDKDKDQINKHLEETKRQSEENQRKLQSEPSEREEERNNPSSNQPQ